MKTGQERSCNFGSKMLLLMGIIGLLLGGVAGAVITLLIIEDETCSASSSPLAEKSFQELRDAILAAYATIGWQHEQLGEASRLIGTYRELLDSMAEQYEELVELCRE